MEEGGAVGGPADRWPPGATGRGSSRENARLLFRVVTHKESVVSTETLSPAPASVKRVKLRVAALLCFCGILLAQQPAPPAARGKASGHGKAESAAARGRFIGVWRLVSVESKAKNGDVSYPYGDKPIGRITYDKAGRMSAQLMRPARNGPTGTTGQTAARNASLEELRDMLNGFASYFGTFDVDESKRTVIHHVRASLYPRAVGTDLMRTYEFSGNRLILTAVLEDFVNRLVWEREPD